MLALLLATAACRAPLRERPTEGGDEVREYLGSPRRTTRTLAVVDTQPELIWKVDAGRGTLGAPAVAARVTTVATTDRFVYAFDTRTGKRLWRVRGDAPYATGPVMGHGRVIVASQGRRGRLTAHSVASGKKRWSRIVGDVQAPLVLGDSLVYGVTTTGTAFAHRVTTGDRVWAQRVGPTASSPLVTGDLLAIVTQQDSLVVLDRYSGEVRDRSALPGTTLAPPALLDDSTLVMTTPAGEIVAAALPGGEVRWRVAAETQILGSPVVARDTVFALSNACALWAVPIARPEAAAAVLGAQPGCVTVAAPGLVRDGVLVATVGGRLLLRARPSGRVLWTGNVGGELRHPPVVLNGQIVTAPIVGDLVSYR